MKITVPMVLTDARLASSNLGEDIDTIAYDAGTTYALGAEVHLVSTHKVYKSTQGSNTGHNPDGDDGTWWVEIGWTNLWKALKQDTANATKAEDDTGIEFEISASQVCTDVGLLGVKSDSVTVVVKDDLAATVSTETQTAVETIKGVSWFISNLIFKDLDIQPGYTVEITIDDTGIDDVAEVAKVVLGRTHNLGDLVVGDSNNSFEDFSTKEQDSDGNFEVEERGYADVLSFDFAHPTSLNWWVKAILVRYRVTPCLFWSDSNLMDAGVFIFGYPEEPSTDVDVTQSRTVFEVIGLAFDTPGVVATIAGTGADTDEITGYAATAYLQVKKSTDQTTPAHTDTPVTWDTLINSNDWAWVSGSNITVPAGVVLAQISCSIGLTNLTTWDSMSSTALLKKNGVTVARWDTTVQELILQRIHIALPVTGGDVLSITFNGTSIADLYGGGNTWLSIEGFTG